MTTKRMVSLFLTLAIAVSIMGCSKKETGPAGTWKLTSVVENGSTFTMDELKYMGNTEYSETWLVLKDGGTAYLQSETEQLLVDWSQSDDGLLINNAVSAEIKEDTLTIHAADGSDMLFSRVSDNQDITALDTAGIENDQIVDSRGNNTAEPETYAETETEAETQIEETTVPASAVRTDFDTGYTIAPTVIVDEKNVKITANSMYYTKSEVQLDVTFENNSSETYKFISGSLGYNCNSVNGYMIPDGYVNVSVEPGKKANKTISIDIDELLAYGITKIADMCISFEVEDDDYESFYPVSASLKTDAAASYDYTADTYMQTIKDGSYYSANGTALNAVSEEPVFERGGLKLLSQVQASNAGGEQLLMLEFENQTDRTILASISDVAVNGMIVTTGNWDTDRFLPHTRGVMTLTLTDMLDEPYWDVVGISDVFRVDYELTVKDENRDVITGPETLSLSTGIDSYELDLSGEELFNASGIRIIYKGLVEDEWSWSDNVHLLLMIENTGSSEIVVADSYNSLSVNGYMMSWYAMYSVSLRPGETGLADIEIYGTSLDDANVKEISDIENIEFTLKIRNSSYSTVAAPTIKVSVQ